MLSSLSNAIGQSTEAKDATEKVILLKSVSNIPQEVLEKIKTSVTENNILINSKKFINAINELFNLKLL